MTLIEDVLEKLRQIDESVDGVTMAYGYTDGHMPTGQIASQDLPATFHVIDEFITWSSNHQQLETDWLIRKLVFVKPTQQGIRLEAQAAALPLIAAFRDRYKDALRLDDFSSSIVAAYFCPSGRHGTDRLPGKVVTLAWGDATYVALELPIFIRTRETGSVST